MINYRWIKGCFIFPTLTSCRLQGLRLHDPACRQAGLRLYDSTLLTYLPTYLLTYLPTYLSAYLPTSRVTSLHTGVLTVKCNINYSKAFTCLAISSSSLVGTTRTVTLELSLLITLGSLARMLFLYGSRVIPR